MSESETKRTVLALGGLDPTGGAGILLDSVAVRAVGAHGAAVITVVGEFIPIRSPGPGKGRIRGRVVRVAGDNNHAGTLLPAGGWTSV